MDTKVLIENFEIEMYESNLKVEEVKISTNNKDLQKYYCIFYQTLKDIRKYFPI